MKALPLDPGYSARIARLDAASWMRVLDTFEDANVYQTWAYDAVRQGARNLLHCLLSHDGHVVAAAQARLATIPGLPVGAAYVRWGPAWRSTTREPDVKHLRMCLRALRNECVLRRGLLLRVFPMLFGEDGDVFTTVLQDEGFVATAREIPQRTLLLGLTSSPEDIRKNFDHKWRNRLSKAERNGLTCIEGTDDALFGMFIGLYRELVGRKKFKEPNDIEEFRTVQTRLPEPHKFRIFLVGRDGAPSCGAVFSAMGATGVYLFGACNHEGMTTNGSYLIQWKAIQWLQQRGCRTYNLNGINPEANPGTYHFKSGAAGREGCDVRYLGRFDAYAGSMTASAVRLAHGAITAGRARMTATLGRRRAGFSGPQATPAAAPPPPVHHE